MANQPSTATEVELKLAADPETLERLWQAPMLRGRDGAAPKVKELENIYFDTADLRLRKRGLAFRIRRDGTRFIQTVKTGDNEAASLFSRGEWEGPVPSLEPQLDIIDDPEIRAALGLILPGELRPVFVTRVHREIQQVNGTDSLGRLKVIEAAFDRGEIEASGSVQPLSEIELELVEGTPRALFDLALALQDVAPTQLETRSKSARGYALATGRKPAWHPAKPLALTAETRTDNALAAVLEACLLHWTANEAAALDGSDPEGVHQMRVGLRRFRSALSVFSELLPEDHHRWLNTEARWALNALGPARDWDVFLAELLAPVEANRPGDKDLAVLRKVAEKRRAEAYQQVREAVSEPRYTRFLLRLGGWLEDRAWHCAALTPAQAVWLDQPLITLANKLLTKRHRKTLKLGKHFDRLSVEKRHEVRIAMKKLRYTTEFFRALYPAKTEKPYLKAMRGLQESLGHLNDVAVAETLLAELAGPRAGARRPAGLDQAIGKVIGWYAHGVLSFEPEMRETWRAFAKTHPFWNGKK
ncbi:CYTH and CHAD domain-containing protein [Pelagibius litoralis]|uniref:CYTH and CHAD domain-containing protein n=1 Tax=Pelagibius litoralis TaxID=374515 RepID=A0A967C944_9PROT|nr:CYTH and CHAD domain-containing protein [Pelagibius litoralis]NIA68842.1 CYTH and CHAD domain-containing protein [Pelagibius litoralis]